MVLFGFVLVLRLINFFYAICGHNNDKHKTSTIEIVCGAVKVAMGSNELDIVKGGPATNDASSGEESRSEGPNEALLPLW